MATNSVKTMLVRSLFSLALGILCLCLVAMPVLAQNNADVAELKQIIEAQQKQLDAQRQLLQEIQAQTLSRLEEAGKEVDRLGRLVKEQQQQLVSLQEQVDQPPEAALPLKQPMTVKPSAADTKMTVQAPADKVVTSGGGERVKLSISGQVNRMVNIVDDGKNTDAYFVDNDNSESRINLVGTAEITDDLTLGSRIELTIAPNKSGVVSQEDQDVNNVFDERWAEVSLNSDGFGKLSLGKGATASYTTASSDLSGTAVIAYATISDTAGGMFFREKDGGALTDVRILDAFNSWDGLSRRNRLRYDTPSFHGFGLATSAISDSRYDAALRWGGQGYGFKAVGAAAFADPNESDAGFQYDGSFSILHEETGLNLTVSAGKLERDHQSDPYNLYSKAGWRKKFFSFGETAFAVDYTRSVNLPTASDDGYSYGVATVQQFDKYGTEVFGLYRLHSLDRSVDAKVDDIGVVSVGARVKF